MTNEEAKVDQESAGKALAIIAASVTPIVEEAGLDATKEAANELGLVLGENQEDIFNKLWTAGYLTGFSEGVDHLVYSAEKGENPKLLGRMNTDG